MMNKLALVLILLVTLISCLKLSIQNASHEGSLMGASGVFEPNRGSGAEELPMKKLPQTTTSSNHQAHNATSSATPQIVTTTAVVATTGDPDPGTGLTSSLPDATTTTQDPEMADDAGGGPGQTTEPSSNPAQTTRLPPGDSNKIVNLSKPITGILAPGNPAENTKLSVLFYSIFIVYVSFIKLVYHNVDLLKGNLTEPGILMIFGIIWELVARQINASYDVSPKFNSRIFFYLFLPSTVLEAAALLSNKWLLLNLFSIIVHSIFGTLLYASALGFTIYSLSQQNVFNLSSLKNGQSSFSTEAISLPGLALQQYNISLATGQEFAEQQQIDNNNRGYLTSSGGVVQSNAETISNLTLADCLMFGTILSSVDSTTMLATFKQLQMNDKLYFLVLGENLLNNAVVLIVFDLLLDFLSESRLTVVKIYFAIIQFFVTLIGSILVGLLLALVALISIRLTKRFQGASNTTTTSYQNQTQTMVETLLILKLAYLTYTLAELTGTSSIVSLATFGILQDQYIKHNLNLRSQLTLRQVVLATRTLGSSLVYPLLGMLLVEVSNSSGFFRAWLSFDQAPSGTMSPSAISGTQTSSSSFQQNLLQLNGPLPSGSLYSAAASIASSKLNQLANQVNLNWNFKFLSLLTMLTIVYRFLIVIVLSFLCNLFTSNQLRIKFKEQILQAYGSFKGPLAFAMVSKLIEHEEYRDRTLRNKHLFMYTILFITFISTILKGCFIRPLVSKIQLSLVQHPSSSQLKLNSSIVFDEINSKITECLSSGLNSILGRTRSPHEKFADFNELTIKPWLSRSGSNTNWLSAFYDNLILDETLNANCFYRSAAGEHSFLSANNSPLVDTSGRDSISMEPAVSGINQMKNHRGKQKRKSSKELRNLILLNTIHENRTLSVRNKLPPNALATARAVGAAGSGAQPSGQQNSVMLKEFVMFNLKLDEARRRKRSRVEPKGLPAVNDLGLESASANRAKHLAACANRVTRMLSTTTSSGDVEAALGKLERIPSTDEELNRRHKQRHLREIEDRLAGASGTKRRFRRRVVDGGGSQLEVLSRPEHRNKNEQRGVRQSTRQSHGK